MFENKKLKDFAVKDNLIVLAYCILANKTPMRQKKFKQVHQLDMSQLEKQLEKIDGYNKLVQNISKAMSVFAFYKIEKK